MPWATPREFRGTDNLFYLLSLDSRHAPIRHLSQLCLAKYHRYVSNLRFFDEFYLGLAFRLLFAYTGGEYKEKTCPSPQLSIVDLPDGPTRIGTAWSIRARNHVVFMRSRIYRATSMRLRSTPPSISRFVPRFRGCGSGRFPTTQSSCSQRNSAGVSRMSAFSRRAISPCSKTACGRCFGRGSWAAC